MAIDTRQLAEELLIPVLVYMRLYSEAAAQLLLGTAAQESRMGTYLRQIEGPAQGIFQMEPATERDVWENFLYYRPALAERARAVKGDTRYPLVWNLAYQTVMARLQYFRVSEPLPAAGDIPAQARYWKKHFNTFRGKGTEAEYLKNYQRFVEKDYGRINFTVGSS